MYRVMCSEIERYTSQKGWILHFFTMRAVNKGKVV